MELTNTENRLAELFEGLVPNIGKADTVAGEIVRAINRITYRYYNDGDQIGIGYGKQTCNPAARYLMNFSGEVEKKVCELWGVYSEHVYEKRLHALEDAVLKYLEENPNLKTTENKDDMIEYLIDDDMKSDEDEEEW